ncbi:MAG: TIGR02099 family protein [Burkholderiales bacterium PBB6]|nr:MAG: TIGR02099 family protein [Burkholderiales bacterium PBB6]
MPLFSSATVRAPVARRLMRSRLLRKLLRLTAWTVFMVWSVALLGWLTLHWGILPHIDEWRPQVEARASAALGLPVRIGRIEVTTGSWLPALTLHDVSLSDAQGRQAVRLPQVSAAVSVQTLLTLRLRLGQLYIDGAQLEVRRDRAGRWHVGGLDMEGGASVDTTDGLDWLFQQREIVIRHGKLRWIDEQRDAPALTLSDTDLVLRNGLRDHDLRLDATPPDGWGERFSVQGRFTQPLLARAGDWQRWSGTLHADLPRADVAALHRHVDLPFELREGDGALRLWLDVVRGQWRAATLDVGLDAVSMRLAKGLAPLALQRVTGRVALSRSADSVSISGQHLSFSTADGLHWPDSRFSLRWQQAQNLSLPGPADAPVRSGELSADRLDVGMLAQLAERLPLPPQVRQGLEDTAPEGVLSGLQVQWTGSPEAPSKYRVRGQIDGLSIASLASSEAGGVGRPGWRDASLLIDAHEAGGQARLTLTDGALDLPGVFEDPVVPLTHFSSRLNWQIKPGKPVTGAAPGVTPPPAIELQVNDVQFANADAQGELQARWRTGDGTGFGTGGRFPGLIELTGVVRKGAAVKVARYLPVGIGADVRQYVTQAVREGTVSNLNFKVRGDLWRFPFDRSRDGDFRIAGRVEGVTLAYVPGNDHGDPAWPAFTQVQGELVFDKASMSIRGAQGRLWGSELRGVNGGIKDLLHQPVLVLDGQVRGPVADGLHYVAATPIGSWLQNALRDTTATGNMDLKLGLSIPLDDSARTTVKGQLQLAGSDVRIRPDLPLFAGTKGRIDFSDKAFSLNNLAVRVLGGDATLDGGLGADGSLKFNLQGQATAEALRKSPELGGLQRLAERMSGHAPYRLQLALRGSKPEFTLTSPLTGMALELPAPLHKPAEASWPLRVQTVLSGDPVGSRDTLRVELGSQAQAEFQRDLTGPWPRVQRGAVAVGEPLPPPAPGQVLAHLKVGALNLDAWSELARALQGPAGAAPADGLSAQALASYQPTDVQLRASELLVEGRTLRQVQIEAQHRQGTDGALWRATVQSEQAQGQLEFKPAAGTQAARFHARLSRLALPPSDADAVDSLLDQASSSVPALDIVVDDFELRGRKLGRLEVEAQVRGVDGRDWRLSRFSLGLPEARLSGSGQWVGGARRRMTMDFKLDMSDGGALLDRLGMGGVVRGGKGRMQGQLAWNGSPLAPDWAAMTGSMNMQLEGGQFLKAELGAARVLGVLSLQSLPRRFLLDFRDVFQQGFSFDSVGGDVTLADGLARTRNLRIRGVQAVVLVEGQADLRRETQDLHMYVVPELNAGTASLYYATINPAIGLGTFLAQVFLRKPLMQASTREFQVTGAWADPQVTAIERNANSPVPDTEEPAAAAPAAAASAPPRLP